jgi:hypothetical protein
MYLFILSGGGLAVAYPAFLEDSPGAAANKDQQPRRKAVA